MVEQSIDLKKLQNKVLEISEYFVAFCEKNDLICYFCGGGCIGAIRHKGFIPWDDDLDFFMPRVSYEKLKVLWKNGEEKNYYITFPSDSYSDHAMYVTIRDVETTMIKPNQLGLDIPHGISIDVFPLDGAPNGKMARNKQLVWALIYQLYCAQLVPANHGRLVTLAGKVMLGLVPLRKTRTKIWKYAEGKMTKYDFPNAKRVTELCAGPKYMMNLYEREWFDSAIMEEFEGKKMPIPKGYDGYLKTAFGDYMKYPPKEQQVPSHEAIIIDTEKSYLMYRNIYKSANKRGKNER